MISFERSQGRFYRKGLAWLSLLLAATILSALSPAVPALAQIYQGFGVDTPGGQDQPVYHVTNLDDSGPGSLRDALSQGNRNIQFDLAGEIFLLDVIRIRAAFITIDGFTAPAPGITLRNYGIQMEGNRGAHDIIVRGIRVRGSGNTTDTVSSDGISIVKGAYNVVVDHVSIDGSEDGNLDIGTDVHDVTVSWSVFTGGKGNMLIKYNTSRVTLHHNLFANSVQRSPTASVDDVGTLATDTTVDMRNNVVWGWGGGMGTTISLGARANIVDNLFAAAGGDQKDALAVKSNGRAFVMDNVSLDYFDFSSQATEAIAFAAPIVDTTEACAAARDVVAAAGVRPLDAVDQQHLAGISIPADPCVIPPEITSPAPGSVLSGADVNFIWRPNLAKVKDWRIYIGSTRGAKDILDSGNLDANKTSRIFRRLPVDGRPIWVQLRYHLVGHWNFVDFQYTAHKKN